MGLVARCNYHFEFLAALTGENTFWKVGSLSNEDHNFDLSYYFKLPEYCRC